MPMPSHPRRGYTLVELTVVVLILGIMMALVVTNLDHMTPRSRLAAAARHIGATMRLAVNEAVSRSRNCVLVYDLRAGKFWLQVPLEEVDAEGKPVERAPGAPEWEDLFLQRLPEDVRITDVALSAETVMTSGVVRVEVTSFGTSSYHIVHLKNADGAQMSVEVNPLTGVVTLTEDYRAPREVLLEED